jgi:death-on-curing protein
MREPVWLTAADIVAIHGEQLTIFGGPPGVRDQGLLESAIARPMNRWVYGETDLAALAAAYAFGISKNHAFVDGNKRAAFAALIVFLRLNDVPFAPDPDEATAAMLELAAGDLDEADLARWIRDVIDGKRPQLKR